MKQQKLPTARRDSVASRRVAWGVLGACGLSAALASSVVASPRKPAKAPAAKASAARPQVKTVASAKMAAHSNRPLPRYLPLRDIKTLQALRGPDGPPPVLQPLFNGRALNGSHTNLATGSADLLAFAAKTLGINNGAGTDAANATGANATGPRLAQAAGVPVPPATVPVAASRAVPKWVRYPLEFQLGGIGLGTLAVDKDEQNRIDRYGLFAIHGNPTAVVVPGGATVMQAPPEYSGLFPAEEFGESPAWAAAISVDIDNNHVEWLYRRETYSMGFVVDRFGYVDAIVVAGTQSPIARTQLEDPVHTIKLGDDLRKVLFRYGYPDAIDTSGTSAVVGAGGANQAAGGGEAGAGMPGAEPGAIGALPGAPGEMAGEAGAAGGATATASPGNSAFRTFELRYEQSYNITFTIRDNRVVRMYIFGNPDFFTEARRQEIRTKY